MTISKGDRLINDTWMDGFSIEKKTFDGCYTQKEVKDELKKLGIKYNTSQAYTPYVGHWAIFIESKYSEMISDWLFGDLWDLPEKLVENKKWLKMKEAKKKKENK